MSRISQSITGRNLKCLLRLYLKYDIPTDQYSWRKQAREALTRDFNRKTGLKKTPEQILHFMITKRKSQEWPRIRKEYFGRNLRKDG